MSKLNKYIQKSYPNFSDLKLNEVFVPEKGWINYSIFNESPDFSHIKELSDMGVTHINFKVVDEFGIAKYPDYGIKELMKNGNK